MSKIKKPRLNELLKYRNPNLIHRFSKDYGLTKRVSETILQDLMRFLWLSNYIIVEAKRNGKALPVKSLQLLEQWLIIDEMWHTFLLFSDDYSAFCKRHFGTIIGHQPNPRIRSKRKSKEVDYEAYVDLVFDSFGSTVANRWFVEYPKKYTKRKVLLQRLKALGNEK